MIALHEAVEELGKYGKEVAVSKILAKMPRRSEVCSYVRIVDGAVEKIGQEDLESILPEMMKAFASDEWCLRWIAATVYASLGGKSFDVVPKLCEAIKYDASYSVRQAANKSLEATSRAAPSPLPEPTVAEWMQDIDRFSENSDAWKRAVEEPGKYGREAAVAVPKILAKMPRCSEVPSYVRIVEATAEQYY